MSEPTCETCRFWNCWDEREPQMVPTDESFRATMKLVNPEGNYEMTENIERKGSCRRYPPSIDAEDNEGFMFPHTTYYTWCGEHQQRKVEAFLARTPVTLLLGTDIDKRLNWRLGHAEKLARRKRLPYIALPDGSIRFKWEDIEAVIREVPIAGTKD